MTDVEAIRALKLAVIEKCKCDKCEAMRMAIAALREKAEREEGCDCCTDDNEFHVINGCGEYSGVEIALNAHLGLIRVRTDCCMDVAHVKACPVCSRNLSGGAAQ